MDRSVPLEVTADIRRATLRDLPALATWHKGLSLESARKLLALQPSVLAVGHGRMLSHPHAAMERAIRAMERSLAKEARKQPDVA